MFYLEKCANCDRSGSVALKASDKLCNLCSVSKKTASVELELKGNRDEGGKFVAKNKKEENNE